MRYEPVMRATFLDRPNRFLARVDLAGEIQTVHVKNTGRLGELLVPGREVILHAPPPAKRKTAYDLIAVRNGEGKLFNIDSQAPNAVVREWLQRSGASQIRPEYPFGTSRMDFSFSMKGRPAILEVKGCTLERDGIGYFPDAPTERGVRHVQELIHAAGSGCLAFLAFVIQMDGVQEVRPNRATHPAFADTMEEAICAGVRVLHLTCHVEEDTLEITSPALQV
ncbi:MAG: DNA/RNA nuclease SfsA [Clostridia bacterium]|nr:DNA/RNA nuclease SfsA [Clostridia bacterium]